MNFQDYEDFSSAAQTKCDPDYQTDNSFVEQRLSG